MLPAAMPAAIVGLLILAFTWILSVKHSPVLGVGVLLGIGAAWAIATLLQFVTVASIPIWLPPLPFAAISIALLWFGALAWPWGNRR